MLLTGFVLIVLTLSIGVDIVSLEPAQGLITFSLALWRLFCSVAAQPLLTICRHRHRH